MDLKNLETTSTYAIEAVYRDYWNYIPEKYRLQERAQRLDHGTYSEDSYDIVKPKPKSKSTPLSYKEVEQKEEPKSEYDRYCEAMNSNQWFDLMPFYDPLLDFENRMHYKLVGIDYPQRNKPWFVITWNCNNGLLNSSLTRRRFETTTITTPGGEDVKFDFINTDLDLTFAIYCNSMQALFELQEVILISKREKCVVNTKSHSVLGSFPVSLDTINSSLNKFTRDKSTLCALTLNVKIDYPVIGNVKLVKSGIIKTINLEIDGVAAGIDMHHVNKDTDVTAHQVLSRDRITEET